MSFDASEKNKAYKNIFLRSEIKIIFRFEKYLKFCLILTPPILIIKNKRQKSLKFIKIYFRLKINL